MPRSPGPPRSRGPCSFCKNQRTMEGNIQKNGDHYLIRRTAEVTILDTTNSAGCVADWEKSTGFIHENPAAYLADPDRLPRLVRQCEDPFPKTCWPRLRVHWNFGPITSSPSSW